MRPETFRHFVIALSATLVLSLIGPPPCFAHGTVVYPMSRVYRIYQANPANPAFALAANAVQIDGSLSYYTWNEVSRNIPQAVTAGLPAGFDYSPWMPDGALASAGRTDPTSSLYPRTYAGLDQVSPQWPTTPVVGGSTLTVQFLVTAFHQPSVWDVWITRPSWNPTLPLTWSEMEFLGRPTATYTAPNFTFDVTVPADRSGHHVLWVAWQRNDPAGEVFISASDIMISSPFGLQMTTTGGGVGDLSLSATALPQFSVEGFTLLSADTSLPLGQGALLGLTPDALTWQGILSPALPGNPLHFTNPFAPGVYPQVPFSLPPGTLTALAGTGLDASLVTLDAAQNLLGATPAQRVIF